MRREGRGENEHQMGRLMMKKLTLNLETLNVQSFAPDTAQRALGTVLAADPTSTTPACCYTFGCGDSIDQAC
jgi:hypothetical protein